MQQLVTRGSYGDTVLLQLVAANTDSSQFAELVRLLVSPASNCHLTPPVATWCHLMPPDAT